MSSAKSQGRVAGKIEMHATNYVACARPTIPLSVLSPADCPLSPYPPFRTDALARDFVDCLRAPLEQASFDTPTKGRFAPERHLIASTEPTGIPDLCLEAEVLRFCRAFVFQKFRSCVRLQTMSIRTTVSLASWLASAGSLPPAARPQKFGESELDPSTIASH
jgi:hypothetical protein